MLPSDSSEPNLYFQLGYSTEKPRAWQISIFVVFGVMDQRLASCMLVHFLEINFKWQFVRKYDIMEMPFFIVFNSRFMHVYLHIT